VRYIKCNRERAVYDLFCVAARKILKNLLLGLFFPDHSPHLFALVFGNLAKGAIFVACSLTLFRGELAPCTQAAQETLFFLCAQFREVLGDIQHALLLRFRQAVPLLG